MRSNSIYCSNGYKPLSSNLMELPNTSFIDGKVVELPIEDNVKRMNYLFEKVCEFESRDKK